MKFIKKILIISALLSPIFSYPSITPLGEGGLNTIPTARFHEDASLLISYKYESETFPYYHKDLRRARKTPGINSTLQFLPWLELSVRYNFSPNQDRLAGIRLRVFEESRVRPAVAIGLRDGLTLLRGVHGRDDFGTQQTSYYNSLYIVSSKSFPQPLLALRQHFDIHLGVGYSDFENAKFQHLHGVFWGVEYTPHLPIPFHFMIDYDTDKIGVGAGFSVLDHFQASISTKGFDNIAVVAGVKISLNGRESKR